MDSLTNKKRALLFLGLLGVGTAGAQTFAPQFDNDVSAQVAATGFTRDGSLFAISGDCTGVVNCGDYFDIVLNRGDTFVASFCPDVGGDASTYDPSLALYRITDLTIPVVANDDNCAVGGLNSRIDYIVTSTGTYRLALGTFSTGTGGPYTLAFSILGVPLIIPTLSQWGLIALAAIVLLLGVRAYRRRSRSPVGSP